MGKWQLQLVDPQGKMWELGSMGYTSASGETQWVLSQIEEYLQKKCKYNGKEFVLADVKETILNDSFHPYHNFRLVWGKVPLYSSEIEEYSQYPNGKDTKWSFLYIANDNIRTLLSGSLPVGWWELDEEERNYRLQTLK